MKSRMSQFNWSSQDSIVIFQNLSLQGKWLEKHNFHNIRMDIVLLYSEGLIPYLNLMLNWFSERKQYFHPSTEYKQEICYMNCKLKWKQITNKVRLTQPLSYN